MLMTLTFHRKCDGALLAHLQEDRSKQLLVFSFLNNLTNKGHLKGNIKNFTTKTIVL